MVSTGSLYSQTLQDITTTKLDELAKRRETFEYYRQRVVALSPKDDNAAENLVTISDIIKACFSLNVVDGKVVRGHNDNARLEIDLINLDRFLAQAKYDPTISTQIVQRWERTLLRHVDVHSLKFTYAWLYGQLTTEWLSSKAPPRPSTTEPDDTEMSDFEHVSGAKKLESRARWEQAVFTATEVDQKAIRDMLSGLFEATPEESTVLPKALEAFKNSVSDFERQLSTSGNFTQYTLQWAIKGLLASDLLTNEKREALRDFSNSDTILSEIADVLNMRLTALQSWSWGKEVPLEERRQLNGTYNIYMHEDLLQALFLQHIGVKWSVFFKSAFRNFRRTKDVWKAPGEKVTTADQKRREYYLGALSKHPSVVSQKQKQYKKDYFVSQLLSSEYQETEGVEGDEEADFEEEAIAVQQQAPQSMMQTARRSTGGKAPRKQLASKAARRSAPSARFLDVAAEVACDEEEEEEEEEEDAESEDDTSSPRNPMAAKQVLLHLLSTDILVQTKLRGELTCFRSQIDNLYPSMPHATIKAFLSYFGVSEKWLEFFGRFLEAPLRFADEESSEPRQRMNGTPGSHVLSEVFGEVILFSLDFLINQSADGEILWRLHDDFWFWSADHAKIVSAWSTVSKFARITGLKLNEARTGAVRVRKDTVSSTGLASVDVGDKLPHGQIRWGMLYLNPDSGRFEIDQGMVDKHIDELSRQLKDKGNSVFAWIQVWNSYASTFFTSNFGKPANCFGQQHVDNMLATHGRIQRQVFTGNASEGDTPGSFVEYLKSVIAARHGIKNVPDGYFYFPTELGGLEIQSPFIELLQVRDAVLADSDKLFREFEAAEKEAYRTAKQNFEDGKTQRRRGRVLDPNFEPEDPDMFLSFDEYIKYREELNYGYQDQLVSVFDKLLGQPQQVGMETDQNGEVCRASNESHASSKITAWFAMTPYWKWVAQLYGPEMIERFGGFKIVDAGLLPMGMVGLFRSGRISWQE